jgi:serine/threonine-protein kinase HipA
LDLILSGALDSLTPLGEDDLAKRMIDLKSQSRAIPTQIEGRFSLAGAQTKDALHWKDGRWHVPGGRIPTTHILKPQPEGIVDLAMNEHFCLQLASKIGLMRASSKVLEIAGRKVLCVERYDRIVDGGLLTRVHQEDTCQALGKGPGQKYQNEGGPSAADIVKLLDRYSDDGVDDTFRFVMALVFNWVIAGTDAHSKNYSLLHVKGSVLRLAPLYDLISNLPSESDPKSSHLTLAMKIGGTYKLREIGAKQWRKWLEEAGLSSMWLGSVVRLVVERISEILEETTNEVAKENDEPFLHRLADKIHDRALGCLKVLE